MRIRLLVNVQIVIRTAILTLLGLAASLGAADLKPLLQPILEASKLPSLAAAVVVGDKIVAKLLHDAAK